MTDNTETIKLCPICGNVPMAMVYTSNPPKYGYSHCGIDSGYCQSESEAVKIWNEQVYLYTHTTIMDCWKELKTMDEFIEKIIVERNKVVDDIILGEIQKIATENGVVTNITLNEKAIVSALKKQIPKKPIKGNSLVRKKRVYELLDAREHEYCSKCNYLVQPPCEKYCSHCGQAIDWSDSE